MSDPNPTEGHPDDLDLIIDFLAATTAVRQMVSNQIVPVARDHKVSERALGILFLVDAGLDRPSQLIEFLNVLPSTITADTEKLVSAGLLEREQLTTDRRGTRLAVTSEGLATWRRALSGLHAHIHARAELVSAAELEACIATLKKITDPLEPALSHEHASLP